MDTQREPLDLEDPRYAQVANRVLQYLVRQIEEFKAYEEKWACFAATLALLEFQVSGCGDPQSFERFLDFFRNRLEQGLAARRGRIIT